MFYIFKPKNDFVLTKNILNYLTSKDSCLKITVGEYGNFLRVEYRESEDQQWSEVGFMETFFKFKDDDVSLDYIEFRQYKLPVYVNGEHLWYDILTLVMKAFGEFSLYDVMNDSEISVDSNEVEHIASAVSKEADDANKIYEEVTPLLRGQTDIEKGLEILERYSGMSLVVMLRIYLLSIDEAIVSKEFIDSLNEEFKKAIKDVKNEMLRKIYTYKFYFFSNYFLTKVSREVVFSDVYEAITADLENTDKTEFKNAELFQVSLISLFRTIMYMYYEVGQNQLEELLESIEKFQYVFRTELFAMYRFYTTGKTKEVFDIYVNTGNRDNAIRNQIKKVSFFEKNMSDFYTNFIYPVIVPKVSFFSKLRLNNTVGNNRRSDKMFWIYLPGFFVTVFVIIVYTVYSLVLRQHSPILAIYSSFEYGRDTLAGLIIVNWLVLGLGFGYTIWLVVSAFRRQAKLIVKIASIFLFINMLFIVVAMNSIIARDNTIYASSKTGFYHGFEYVPYSEIASVNVEIDQGKKNTAILPTVEFVYKNGASRKVVFAKIKDQCEVLKSLFGQLSLAGVKVNTTKADADLEKLGCPVK